MKTKQYIVVFLVAAAFAGGCREDPVVTAAKRLHDEFIGVEPKAVDITGTYILNDQTIAPGGMSALGGRQCELQVLPDGTFSITNYPEVSGHPFSAFHSIKGTWRLTTVGTSYGYGPNPKECWGLRFDRTSQRIDPTAFTGPEKPYGLLTILGDPDSNFTIRFRKKEESTRSSTAAE